MSYQYLENRELSQALQEYTSQLALDQVRLAEEEIGLQEALGRITSRAVLASISAPHYYACAMDGIAVRSKETFGATDTTPVRLTLGDGYEPVDTGDPLPQGMDAVIMIEDVVYETDGIATLYGAAHPWQHIRQIGEDICQEEMILPSNMAISPAAIGAMLAGGIGKVWVYRKPVIGLIPTGDEIVPPTPHPKRGEIIEFNSSIFSSMVRMWGCDAITYPIVPDHLDKIKAALLLAASECDVVILNAGSSAGREDFASRAIEETGAVFVHGIAIKPGKPTILGKVGDKPAIGVPGYPVSGIIVMEQLVKPLVEQLLKIPMPTPDSLEATLSRRVMSSLKYREFVRMKVGKVGDRYIATPLDRGAGVVTSFVKADGLLDIPINTEGLEGGSAVSIQLLRDRSTIEHTLMINGSHDPLIDTVYDLLRKQNYHLYVSSSHVGSMGGIMAIKRDETHVAGIHLLDEATGEYNRAFIQRYLADVDLVLVQGVKRSQGLMVAKGNPLNIQGLGDVVAKEASYVNRQKGSGTRILLDYLLKRQNLDGGNIYGYDREELTHLSVAVQIASGSADAGLGIYSAAKAYGLDFIPICWESYDFILREAYLEDDKIQQFLQMLRSENFALALEQLGGYELKGIGTLQSIKGGTT
jgi:putative molybdopterin biosynthesis protein